MAWSPYFIVTPNFTANIGLDFVMWLASTWHYLRIALINLLFRNYILHYSTCPTYLLSRIRFGLESMTAAVADGRLDISIVQR